MLRPFIWSGINKHLYLNQVELCELVFQFFTG